MGTAPPRVLEAFQGSRGELREKGIQGGGANYSKGILNNFAMFCFFWCDKKWIIPPSEHSLNIHTPPSLETLLETKNSHQSVGQDRQETSLTNWRGQPIGHSGPTSFLSHEIHEMQSVTQKTPCNDRLVQYLIENCSLRLGFSMTVTAS